MFVYVINFDDQPLMPCKPTKAKHLLKEGKAKVVNRSPFTIKLLWQCEDNKQPVIAGMDTGSKVIGGWQFLPEAKDFGVSLPQDI